MLLAMMILAADGYGQVVVSDDFQDGSRDGWYRTSGGTLYVASDSSGIGSGNALFLEVDSSSYQRRILTHFNAVELKNIGDSIALRFDFRITGSGSLKNGFRFGIFNASGTLQNSDAVSGSSSANAADDTGFFVMQSLGALNTVRLVRERGETNSFIGGGDLSYHATDDYFGSIDDAARHSAEFSLTLLSGGLKLTYTLDGAKTIETVTSATVTAFDEIGFAGTGNESSFVIDNVRVESLLHTFAFGRLAVSTTMDALEVAVEISNVDIQPRSVRLRHRLYEDEDTQQSPFLEVLSSPQNVPAGGIETLNYQQSGLSPKCWSPEAPNLYLLRSELLDDADQVVMQKDTVIGFRTFEVVGKHFHLNGKPTYLFAWHRTPPMRIPFSVSDDPSFIQQHIQRLKSLNVNFVRLNEGASQSWFEACDRAGIMVMTGPYSGLATSDVNAWLDNFSRLESEIHRLRNHPCIVKWILGNEWVLSEPGMTDSAQSIYSAAKALDPSRLMFLTWTGKYYNGGDLAAKTGSDFLSFHNYRGWYGGSVYGFYNYEIDNAYPSTLGECVGSYTDEDPLNMSYRADADKQLANLLRNVGHSYAFSDDSLGYQSYLTRQVVETLRRGRGPDSSFCGAMPFTNGYAYAYLHDPTDITEYAKPVMDQIGKAYAPVHISVRSPYPNLYAGDSTDVRVYVMNDDKVRFETLLPSTTLEMELLSPSDAMVWSGQFAVPSVAYYDSWDRTVTIEVPGSAEQGMFRLRSRLLLNAESITDSEEEFFVARREWMRIPDAAQYSVALYDTTGQTEAQLRTLGLNPVRLSQLQFGGALLSDGFEDCFVNWTVSGPYCSGYAYDGSRSCKMDTRDSIETAVSTAGSNAVTVRYVRNLADLETDDLFFCEWYDGTAWRLLEQSGPDAAGWTAKDYPLPAGAANNTAFRLRFRMQGGSGRYGYVDTLTISGQTGSDLSAYQLLIIGKDSFDATVVGAESMLSDFMAAGNRILILEQESSAAQSTFNGSSWLETGLSLSGTGGEDFVNIERPYLGTLMNGLKHSDFRIWNRNGSSLPEDRTLYNRHYRFTDSDMDRIAVLGNAGQHLSEAVLLEIFPNGGTGGSCILSQLRTVGRYREDPKAARYLGNLIAYAMESSPHFQYVQIGNTIELSRFESEGGLFFAPLRQGLYLVDREGDGRMFRGTMKIAGSLGYLEQDNTAARERCPLYLRTAADIGRSPVKVEVSNRHSATLGYRIHINGWASGWVTLTAGQHLVSALMPTSVIPAGTSIKLEIEADEGRHDWGSSTGLVFHRIELVGSQICDFTGDGETGLNDLAILATEYWLTDGRSGGDLNSDGRVDLLDFAVCTKFWLE